MFHQFGNVVHFLLITADMRYYDFCFLFKLFDQVNVRVIRFKWPIFFFWFDYFVYCFRDFYTEIRVIVI